ncbi:hypothetical protein NP233_g4983 [Leucocoprinus birnbaumii]|uniref:G domain-containing protein n=1 Tax=Leucocoprinus birnbaumii TaxID=56174 RepID=A0AAD5VTT2_9AGAR|nr:hypothetical protein NP233_g4983 [Leucocoprinus birnbaumii]
MGRRSRTTLKSVTRDVEATRMPSDGNNPNGRHFVFVDTPGFDEKDRSDMQILTLINEWLKTTYKRDVKLSGLIYLHPITHNRMAGIPYRNLRMFGELCGDVAMSQVVLVTTMWERLGLYEGQEGEEGQKVGERRVQELRNKFWKELIEKGSEVDALKKATTEEAWRVVNKLIERRKDLEKTAVLLQQEVVDKNIALKETQAGQALYTDYQKRLAAQKERMKKVLEQVDKSKDPGLKKELQKEYDRIRKEFDKTFAESETLKRSLLDRFLSLFKGKPKAKGVKISAEGL